MKNLDFCRGDVVIAIQHLDVEGANVRKGTMGVIFEPANYYKDGGGPMVRWMNMGICNIYPDDIIRVNKSYQGKTEVSNTETGETISLPFKIWND